MRIILRAEFTGNKHKCMHHCGLRRMPENENIENKSETIEMNEATPTNDYS